MNKIALVVDDNKQNRDLLQMMLKANGVTPVALESPRNLEQAMNEHGPFAVIFLDLEFPNYNGIALIRQFKADPRLNGAPIIAYTVHTSEIEAARAAGFDGFLGKPLKPHQFASQLQAILNGEAVWD